MAHEILYVKLHELDQRIGRLHSRIQLSENAHPDQLSREIEILRKECAVNELALRNKLRFSRAAAVTEISAAYTKVEQVMKRVKTELGGGGTQEWRQAVTAEENILLAEYALDFAVQTAEYALLISLEAIEAQITEQEKERRNE